jgi:hypothetical protein
MKIRYEDVKATLQQLVQDGLLVAVEEIDPKTGKMRYRYFATECAPKPN